MTLIYTVLNISVYAYLIAVLIVVFNREKFTFNSEYTISQLLVTSGFILFIAWLLLVGAVITSTDLINILKVLF